MVSQAELILRVITLWFLVLSQFFRDGMGPFKEAPLPLRDFFVYRIDNDTGTQDIKALLEEHNVEVRKLLHVCKDGSISV